MPADQAAGLRRRSTQQPLRCIHCFFDSDESTIRLMQALHQRGWISLLVDTCGRIFRDSPTRSLFDWKQQIARGPLHTLSQTYGDGWYAPGVHADEPALRDAARGYDHVVFDAGPAGADLALMPGATHTVIIEVQPTHESMLRAYTLLKILSHTEGVFSVGLLGDTVACDHVQAACRHFLEQRFTQAIYNALHEDDAFAALAARMAHEEASLSTRYKTGTP